MTAPWQWPPWRHRKFLVRFFWLSVALLSPPLLMRVSFVVFFLPALFWWNIAGLVVNPIQHAFGYDLFKYEEFGIIAKSKADETLALVLMCSFWVVVAFLLALLTRRSPSPSPNGSDAAR